MPSDAPTPLQAPLGARAERLGRLPLARIDPRRAPAGADRRLLGRRRDLEPVDLREGDGLGRAPTTSRSTSSPRRAATSRRPSGRSPSRTSGTRATLFRPVWDGGQRPRRLRLARGRPAPRLRHAGDLPRGDAPARGGRPAQPDGQDPRDQAGAGGDRGRDRQGPLDQRHADLLAAPLRGGRRVLRARASSGWSPRAATRARSRRWRASSSRGSTPRPTGAWTAIGGHDELQGQARDRQREARLRALPGGLLRPALGVPRGQGRHARSACCGPRPRPRTPPTPTRCTSRS